MDTLTQSLITLVIGGFLGGVIKSLLDYRSKVFSFLWEKRVDAYKSLWAKMKLFPLYPKSLDVTYLDVLEWSKGMKDWYFETGGILLSKKTRLFFLALQKDVNGRILKKKESETALITDADYDAIQNQCHLLRNEITNDLLSRKKQL